MQEGYQFPAGCPLDPRNDRLKFHEENKKRVRHKQFQCQLCGKTFRNESWVDLHMDRRHADTAPRAQACLADHCNSFRCNDDTSNRGTRQRGRVRCRRGAATARRRSDLTPTLIGAVCGEPHGC